MKDYSSIVFAEILVLLAIIVFLSERAQKVWGAILGQVTIIQGAKPATITAVNQFTPLGLILASFIVLKTARGTWGYMWVWLLGALIAAGVTINYKQILSVFFGSSLNVK